MALTNFGLGNPTFLAIIRYLPANQIAHEFTFSEERNMIYYRFLASMNTAYPLLKNKSVSKRDSRRKSG